MADDSNHRDDESGHRFTDREVAILLQRAAEIEARRSDAPPMQGMSLRQLRDIAAEVGISSEVFEEAVTAVQAGAKPGRRELLGAPLTYKAARGVEEHLDEMAMQRLIRVLEEAMDESGTVTDALGEVRWTSLPADGRFDPTTQVSLFRKSNETQILVVRRHPVLMPIFLHVLPPIWAGALGTAVTAGLHAADSTILMAFGTCALVGAAIGRAIWQKIAARSAQKVKRLADTLSTAARDLVEK